MWDSTASYPVLIGTGLKVEGLCLFLTLSKLFVNTAAVDATPSVASRDHGAVPLDSGNSTVGRLNALPAAPGDDPSVRGYSAAAATRRMEPSSHNRSI